MDSCPDCGSTDIKEEQKNGPIEYKDIVLYAVVPVFVCQACNYQWTDYRAEFIRQQVINSVKGGM